MTANPTERLRLKWKRHNCHGSTILYGRTWNSLDVHQQRWIDKKTVVYAIDIISVKRYLNQCSRMDETGADYAGKWKPEEKHMQYTNIYGFREDVCDPVCRTGKDTDICGLLLDSEEGGWDDLGGDGILAHICCRVIESWSMSAPECSMPGLST